MRKIGEVVLVKIWNVVCDIVSVLYLVFLVALRPTQKVTLKARAMRSAIAAGITSMTIIKLASGSYIATGVMYGVASIQKWIGILWASEGDWSHWMSGGRYLVFKAIKEDIIATDNFASFLSSLAGKGIFLKAVQLGIIALCFASAICLFLVFFKCVCTFYYSIKAMTVRRAVRSRKHRRNIVKFRNNCHNSSKITEFPKAKRKKIV